VGIPFQEAPTRCTDDERMLAKFEGYLEVFGRGEWPPEEK